MITYLFYPRRPDGSALTFEAIDLASDSEAILEASHVLSAHPSAIEVVVWDGERRIGCVSRDGSPTAEIASGAAGSAPTA